MVVVVVDFYLSRDERERVGGAEGEVQADSGPGAEPSVGLDLTTLITQTEPKPRVRHSTDLVSQPPSHLYRDF